MTKMKTDGVEKQFHQNGQFKNSLGFVLACVGSAVGMGNIWLFPYRLGQYGGAAFLIPYFIFIVLFGMVGLSPQSLLSDDGHKQEPSGLMSIAGKAGKKERSVIC